MVKRQQLSGLAMPDFIAQHPKILEESKFTWGNCMSAKRQFPVNVASEQLAKSPDQRVVKQHNYYIEEVLHRPIELKKMQQKIIE
jgi:hypothetical protein